jgi:radical SAM superfamily enzyme YgiQ (UPF0313 family)
MSFNNVLLIKPQGRHGLSYAFDIIPTGLEYIAASIEDVVKKVDIIDLEMDVKPPYETLETYLDSIKPDIVGISMSSTDHIQGLEIARRAKKRGMSVVLGGFHPTAITDELLTHKDVDFIVRGEGELTMRELVQKGSAEGVAGTSYRNDGKTVHNPDRPVVEDLDTIPLPARHLRRYKYYLAMARGREYDVITTSRGCWGRCSFCCEPSMSGSKQRYRKPEAVLDEILKIKKFHHGKPVVCEITDPHFMGKPPLVEKLCDLLAKQNLDIEFIAKVRPDTMAAHPDIVKKMVSVGIASYEMGIESPSSRDLDYTSKGVKTEMHIKAAHNIRQWGGDPGGSFVIGLPDQTEEEILQFPAYAKKIGLLSSAYAIATPYPGTKFYEQLDSEGLIFEKAWNRFDEMHSTFKTKHLTSRRIEELAVICMSKFWTLDSFLERERVRQIRRPGKTPLPKLASHILHDLMWSANSQYELQSQDFKAFAAFTFAAAADPYVRQYTEKWGMHNIIEMSRFLQIIGDQKMQLTVKDHGKVLVSFVMKTDGKVVEYMQTLPRKSDGCTIDMEFNIEDLIIEGKLDRTLLDFLKAGLKIFRSNRGLARKLNLFKVMMAGGAELVRYFRMKRNTKASGALKAANN